MICAETNAKTDIYGVIADPVAHSFSPVIHNTIARLRGDNLVYTAFHVKAEVLAAAVAGASALSIKGLNVTLPHKHNVMRFLTEADRTAVEAGAANTLKFSNESCVGYNTDIIGAKNSLAAAGVALKGKKAVVLGAGGSARAAAVALASDGVRELVIANRTLENAVNLAEQVKRFYDINITVVPLDQIASIGGADVMINSTTSGFGSQADTSPVTDFGIFSEIAVLFDFIYIPWETTLIRGARDKGTFCINGFDMLIYQAVASYEIWRGISLDKEFVTNLIENLKKYYQNI